MYIHFLRIPIWYYLYLPYKEQMFPLEHSLNTIISSIHQLRSLWGCIFDCILHVDSLKGGFSALGGPPVLLPRPPLDLPEIIINSNQEHRLILSNHVFRFTTWINNTCGASIIKEQFRRTTKVSNAAKYPAVSLTMSRRTKSCLLKFLVNLDAQYLGYYVSPIVFVQTYFAWFIHRSGT